jgi:hypothetical protein
MQENLSSMVATSEGGFWFYDSARNIIVVYRLAEFAVPGVSQIEVRYER